MTTKSDHSINGIPVYVSPYADKGTIMLLPDFDDNPMIVADSMTTLEEKLEEWFKEHEGKFAVIKNVGTPES